MSKTDTTPGLKSATSSSTLSNQSLTQFQNPQSQLAASSQPQQNTVESLNSLFNVVNNSLAALLAHTAATAHAAATLTATNQYYASVYQSQNQHREDMIKAKAFSKEEIKKASNTFATFKDKIANFFETSKQVETKINEMKENASSGLQLLMSNYGNDDSEAEEDAETKNGNKSVKCTEITKEKSDSETEEEDEPDDDEDLEIVTTSEIRDQLTQPNYLLPSLKASYFPLKASLEISNLKPTKNSNNLIIVEKSKYALTFLGNSIGLSNSVGSRNRPKLSDILFK